MARKRGNNEGTVVKRKDGRWMAAVTVGYDPQTGKPRRAYFYGKTRQEAAERLAKALNDLKQGIPVEPSRVTVAGWLDTWLNEYKKPPRIRPTTWQNYEYLIRVHIKPAIGSIRLRQLAPSHLQKLYNEKSACGLSPRTVRLIHTIMHAALKQAMKEGLVARNVAEATTLPKQARKEPRVLTLEEQKRFFEVLEQDRLGAAFLLDLATGMRRGEILALRWEDLDLREGIIRVRRELVRVKDPDTGKGVLIFQEPKSEKGRRSIPLPEWAVAALKAHRKRQLEEKLALGEAYEDNGLAPRSLARRWTRETLTASLTS